MCGVVRSLPNVEGKIRNEKVAHPPTSLQGCSEKCPRCRPHANRPSASPRLRRLVLTDSSPYSKNKAREGTCGGHDSL